MNTVIDTFETIKNNFQTLNYETLQHYFPLIIGSLVIMIFMICNRPKQKRSHTKQIHDVTEMVIKNKAIIGSFELMVGTLMKKMEKFETVLYENNCEIKKLMAMYESLDHATNDSFVITSKVVTENHKNLLRKHQNLKEEIKIIHDAIFVPDEEDDENDSDYVC